MKIVISTTVTQKCIKEILGNKIICKLVQTETFDILHLFSLIKYLGNSKIFWSNDVNLNGQKCPTCTCYWMKINEIVAKPRKWCHLFCSTLEMWQFPKSCWDIIYLHIYCNFFWTKFLKHWTKIPRFNPTTKWLSTFLKFVRHALSFW